MGGACPSAQALPLWLKTYRVVAMERATPASPRESTEAMVRNIGRELVEIKQAGTGTRADCRACVAETAAGRV